MALDRAKRRDGSSRIKFEIVNPKFNTISKFKLSKNQKVLDFEFQSFEIVQDFDI